MAQPETNATLQAMANTCFFMVILPGKMIGMSGGNTILQSQRRINTPVRERASG
jgi:hypothetical protein